MSEPAFFAFWRRDASGRHLVLRSDAYQVRLTEAEAKALAAFLEEER